MIYLDKNLITELSPEGVIAYVAIRMSMHTKDQTEGYFSPGNMFYALGIPFEEEHYSSLESRMKKFKNIFKHGLDELLTCGYIKALQHDRINHAWVLDISKLILNTKTTYFIMVEEEEMYRLTSSGHFNSTPAILKYFLVILGSINYDTKVASMPISYYAQVTGISEKTAQRYNDGLEFLCLLYIHRSIDFIKQGDKLSQITNCYSRYVDMETCNRVARQFEERHGHVIKTYKSRVTKDKADKNRSLAQKYYQMLKGKTYDEETTKEVMDYIIEKNKSVQEEIDFFTTGPMGLTENDNLIKYFKSQIKDMSVFTK